jgi:hypothetical protein
MASRSILPDEHKRNRSGNGGPVLSLSLPVILADVRCTNCGPSWMDYVAAAIGLLGAVLAGIALWLTHKSAEDAEESRKASERSAKAAEDELILFKEEVTTTRAERARRAAFSIRLTARTGIISSQQPPANITIDFGIQNTGDRPADRVPVNIVVPRQLSLTPADGTGRIAEADDQDLGRGREPCIYWSAVLGPFDPDVNYVPARLAIRNAPAGTHPIYIELMHDDLPRRARAEAWDLVVPPSGSEVTLRRANADASLWRPTD